MVQALRRITFKNLGPEEYSSLKWVKIKLDNFNNFRKDDDLKIEIKRIKESELRKIWEQGFSEENPEWTEWDAPYFDDYEYMTYKDFVASKGKVFLSERARGIYLKGEIIGMVSKVWIDEKTRWLEIGISIYSPDRWSGGIGTKALKLWVSEIFKTTENLEHIGLTTWSGNHRMMRAAEKIGMQQEARIRKVRWHNNIFYDSVKYGILREEFEKS